MSFNFTLLALWHQIRHDLRRLGMNQLAALALIIGISVTHLAALGQQVDSLCNSFAFWLANGDIVFYGLLLAIALFLVARGLFKALKAALVGTYIMGCAIVLLVAYQAFEGYGFIARSLLIVAMAGFLVWGMFKPGEPTPREA